LRDLTSADFEALLALEMAPSTRYYEVEPASAIQVEQFLQSGLDEVSQSPRHNFHLALCQREAPDHLIGLVKLALNFSDIREWEIGWALHPAYWHQGYAHEAASALLDFAFRTLNAHRVVAFCHADNAASVRLMQRLGMQCDGTLRETRRWQDTWVDEYVYSLLEREWLIPLDGSR
jgi:RimJ/RimL family protein N-acetyltransferase